jgi:hypothetical protein
VQLTSSSRSESTSGPDLSAGALKTIRQVGQRMSRPAGDGCLIRNAARQPLQVRIVTDMLHHLRDHSGPKEPKLNLRDRIRLCNVFRRLVAAVVRTPRRWSSACPKRRPFVGRFFIPIEKSRYAQRNSKQVVDRKAQVPVDLANPEKPVPQFD